MSRQTWSGKFVFGDLWGAYLGTAFDNGMHAHVAVQVTLGYGDDVSIDLGGGRAIRAPVVIVGPLVRHRLLPSSGTVALIYVEPLSPLAARLLDFIRPEKAGVPPQDAALSLRKNERPEDWVVRLTAALGAQINPFDARLELALTKAARDSAPGAVGRAAKAAGLSEARLRALAKAQLGAPVSQLLLWRKLQAASRAMAHGETLSAAAMAGGFADQAHLTRTMRRMFGITPSFARAAIRRE